MAKEKATFNVGVFGIPAKLIGNIVKIKVNVRTDQANQKKIAGLPEDSQVQLVDCPGGAVKPGDTSLWEALKREIGEETGGCTIEPLGKFRQPLELMKGSSYDLAFWRPVRLNGQPQPSDEASDHPWVSRQELETADKYRAVSGLGLAGRTGRMMVAALDFYETNRGDFSLFS